MRIDIRINRIQARRVQECGFVKRLLVVIVYLIETTALSTCIPGK